MNTFDVVVIGGGAAGTAAGLSASRAGARVAIVRRAPGAAALAGGGWSDSPPPAMRDALAAAGLELAECRGALPHPDGVLVRCELAAVSHSSAAIASIHRDSEAPHALVCGINGLPSFHAPALAALWSEEAALPDGALRAVTIEIPGTPSAGWSPVSLAAVLEKEPERFSAALGRVAREHGASRVIVPAVLGMTDHARVFSAVQDAAGVEVGEALGTAPSIPGWRVDLALRRALDSADVHVIHGRARAAGEHAGSGRRIRSITIEGSSGAPAIDARVFVLATGKYIGGGIAAESEFEERTFGCDVALERFARTIDDPGAALMLTDPVRTEPQPVLSAGVRVDAQGRPLTPSGDVFLANVFVAGSVRAGVEAATLGLGSAMHDGWAAGERAAALAAGG